MEARREDAGFFVAHHSLRDYNHRAMATPFTLDAGWIGSPLKRSRFPNALGLIEPNKDGLQDSFADILRNLGVKNRSLALGRPAATATPSSRYSLLSLSKDPAADPQLDALLASLGRRSATGNALLSRFNASLDKTLGDNELDIGQESEAINDVFTGRLGDSLRRANDATRITAEATNNADAAALKAIRDAYGTDQAGAIRQLYANLGKNRADFEARTSGDIATEVARRDADARGFGIAARRSTDQSIADASRENKAQFGQEGGGGSSYASRLGMGQRIRANTALEQALAELRMQNTEKELFRRADLTDRVSGLERGDITGEGQAGLNLGSDLNTQDYRNIAATMGRRQSIEDTFGARDLAAIQYEQAQKAGLLGARAGLRRSSLQDLLTGLNANQSFDSNEIRNLGALGEVRRANRFLGVDDGTGDALRFPRIPNFSRGGGGGLPYADDMYFDPSIYGGGGDDWLMQGPGESAVSYKLRTGRNAKQSASPSYGDPYGVTVNPVPLRPEERYDGSWELEQALRRRTFSVN